MGTKILKSFNTPTHAHTDHTKVFHFYKIHPRKQQNHASPKSRFFCLHHFSIFLQLKKLRFSLIHWPLRCLSQRLVMKYASSFNKLGFTVNTELNELAPLPLPAVRHHLSWSLFCSGTVFNLWSKLKWWGKQLQLTIMSHRGTDSDLLPSLIGEEGMKKMKGVENKHLPFLWSVSLWIVISSAYIIYMTEVQ